MVAAFAMIASCTTSGGGNIFSDAAPKSSEQAAAQTDVDTGPSTQNPNARPRLKNTQNALSEYCPALRIRAGTESIRFYKGKDRSTDDNLRYQATITRVARECNYTGETLEIKMGAIGRMITGPSGASGDVSLPIRVAIQQGGCTRHFQLHKLPASVASGQTSGKFEFVDEVISIPAPTSTNVRMFIGFDETPDSKPSAESCA